MRKGKTGDQPETYKDEVEATDPTGTSRRKFLTASASDRFPRGMNSEGNPYRPNFLGSCCYKGQNPIAPDYVLRP